MDDAQNPRMAPLSDTSRLQGKQCWIETRISQLQCFTETGNDPKQTSPSQHQPQEVTRPSVFHSNSTGAKGTTGNTLPKDGDITIPRHKLEETPLTKLIFSARPVVLIPPFLWCEEPVAAL